MGANGTTIKGVIRDVDVNKFVDPRSVELKPEDSMAGVVLDDIIRGVDQDRDAAKPITPDTSAYVLREGSKVGGGYSVKLDPAVRNGATRTPSV